MTAPNPNNCIAYYKLDETSGTTAFDSTPNENDGTANNARVFTSEITGVVNTGADFTQGDDYIDITSIGAISGEATISGWYNFQGSSSQQYIARFHTNQNSQFALIRGYNGESIELYFSGSARRVIISSPSTNNWYHIVFVKTSNTNVDAYVNGDYVDSLTINSLASFSPLLLGAGTGSSQGIVYIDEVAIFDTALTSDEISFLYASGSPTSGQQYPFSSTPPPFTITTQTATNIFSDQATLNGEVEDLE